jgi:hypothetical protein
MRMTASGKQPAERRQYRLINYDRGRREILAAVKIDEVVEIKDKAEQLHRYGIRERTSRSSLFMGA